MMNSFLYSPEISSFNLFGFEIYFYGIVLAFAVLVGLLTAHKLYKSFYGNEGLFFIYDYSPYLILSGIFGARLYYCLVNLPYYMERPLEIFNIRQGGLSVHGMIIAGILALWILAKYKKVSFLKLADVYLCSSLLAQGIGRWGNFFNNEAFGYPTNGNWGLFIPVSNRPEEFANFQYFHPTFLYESLLDFAGFFVLLFLFGKFNKKSGLIACCYLVLYSLIRIFVESFRVDSVLNISGCPVATVMSIILTVLGIISTVYIARKSN